MNLNKDFKEFIRLLNSHNVEYLLIGGWSVAIHGHPRYTKDIDFFIYSSEANAIKLTSMLKEFGFEFDNLDHKDFISKGQIIQLGFEPNRIDLITEIKGVDFHDAWARKEVVEFDQIKINVISKQDLITNKIATGRLQDFS